MKRVAVLAGMLVLVACPLTAQRAGQFEAGAFGAYTRYDPAFGLGQKPGGGVRLGYFLNNFIGVEGDVLFQPEYTVTPPGGTANTLQPLIAGASLVVNALRAPRLTLYALGGYSLLDFGTRAPYHFTDKCRARRRRHPSVSHQSHRRARRGPGDRHPEYEVRRPPECHALSRHRRPLGAPSRHGAQGLRRRRRARQ